LKERIVNPPLRQAGQVGIEPTTPAFGERCSAKLSYWPVLGRTVARPGAQPCAPTNALFALFMHRVFAAARAEFLYLKPALVVAPVFLGRVISLLAVGACQCDHRPDIL
jgi:hypothetical protein